MKGNKHMKTITSITYPVFALFAFACFAAAAGVLGTESIDEGVNLPVQSDMVNVSPELAGVETQTVLGLYNPSTHETRLWYMNNNVHVGTVAGPRLPPRWSPVAAADFNGDGHIDVLFFNTISRQTWIGYLFGATQGDYGPTLPSGYEVITTADFNHDGHPDLLLNSSTYRTTIWYMNNNIRIGTALGPFVYPLIPLLAVGDFNGDGYPDYLLAHPSLGQIWILDTHNNVSTGLNTSRVAAGHWRGFFYAGATDFSRNGKADLLLYNSSTRQTAIWYMNNNVAVGSASGPGIPRGWDLFAPSIHR